MGFKQHISRTWQMIEQQVNDVPFRPDNEANEVNQMALNFSGPIFLPAIVVKTLFHRDSSSFCLLRRVERVRYS